MNRFALTSALLSLSLVACSDDSSSSEPPIVQSDLARDTTPDATPADIDALVAGNTQFGVNLYKLAAARLSVSDQSGNMFMSAHSISSALAMTYAGANGTTATQIADVFGFTPSVHAAQNALDLELESRAEDGSSDEIPFKLTTANSIWGQEGKDFQAPFLDTLAVNYGAGLHVLDFLADPDGSRQVINGWVADRTNNKIDKLLPSGSVTSDTRLVLTNAVYFSAAWAEPFSADNTADRPFELSDAVAPIQVPTLSNPYLEANYAAGESWKAVEIPYDGNKLSMVVVLPGNLDTFEDALTPAVLEEITSSLRQYAVDLQLPKFKFRAPLNLSDFLKELGMTDAFDNADFSGIDGTRDLVIQDVIHEGFVAIDEKGTEAAAATAVLVGDTAAPEQATFHADRPFVFFIRDIETKEILFLGRVVDPRN